MRLLAPLLLGLACAGFLALTARAELAVNCPAPAAGAPTLLPYDLLTAALRERGFGLSAWKVRAGNAVEMWDRPDGAWVVLEVSPRRCAWMLVDLAQEGDRLVSPPGADLADPEPMRPAVKG